jgi:superfamily II DNA or RNA helicase
MLRIPIEYLNSSDMHKFCIRNLKYGTYAKEPEFYEFWTPDKAYIAIPRNFPLDIDFPNMFIEDQTVLGSPINLPKPKFTPRDYQMDAVYSLMKYKEDGIITAPCGAGKTVIGCTLAYYYKRKTAVLVSTEQLLSQWVDRIDSMFGIQAGTYYGKGKVDGDIVIFSVGSLYNKLLDQDYADQFGLVIFDECHEAGATEWNKSLMSFKGKFRVGLSATPDRKDGLDALMYYALGNIRHEVPRQTLIAANQVLVPEVLFVTVDFPNTIVELKGQRAAAALSKYRSGDTPLDMANTMTEFALHEGRNQILVDLVKKCLRNNRKILLVVNRTAAIENLSRIFTQYRIKFGVLKGGTKDYDSAYKSQVIIGMLNVVKRGLDIPDLDTAILGCPVSDKGLIEQLLGRISRPHPDKKTPLMIDVLDKAHMAFVMMRQSRKKVYKELECHYRNGNS